jgi:hypothetical protein
MNRIDRQYHLIVFVTIVLPGVSTSMVERPEAPADSRPDEVIRFHEGLA